MQIGRQAMVRTRGVADELRLMMDPVLVGGGKRIFPDYAQLRSLRLVDSQVTTTRAILATYTLSNV